MQTKLKTAQKALPSFWLILMQLTTTICALKCCEGDLTLSDVGCSGECEGIGESFGTASKEFCRTFYEVGTKNRHKQNCGKPSIIYETQSDVGLSQISSISCDVDYCNNKTTDETWLAKCDWPKEPVSEENLVCACEKEGMRHTNLAMVAGGNVHEIMNLCENKRCSASVIREKMAILDPSHDLHGSPILCTYISGIKEVHGCDILWPSQAWKSTTLRTVSMMYHGSYIGMEARIHCRDFSMCNSKPQLSSFFSCPDDLSREQLAYFGSELGRNNNRTRSKTGSDGNINVLGIVVVVLISLLVLGFSGFCVRTFWFDFARRSSITYEDELPVREFETGL